MKHIMMIATTFMIALGIVSSIKIRQVTCSSVTSTETCNSNNNCYWDLDDKECKEKDKDFCSSLTTEESCNKENKCSWDMDDMECGEKELS